MGQENEGRVVIITGAAGGVGTTVTRRWLDSGAAVLAVDHAPAPLETLRDALSATDTNRLATVPCDVTTAGGAERMVAAARDAHGRAPDSLVHLVGGFGMGRLDAGDAVATWERLMAINLWSSVHCYRAMLPALKAQGGGWIVGMASRAAITPPAELGAYAGTKAALIALTQSLAAEVRSEGIHVNIVLASTIDTPANRKAMGDDAARDWVRPDDIADATLYLCSERARAVHGATLEVYANA